MDQREAATLRGDIVHARRSGDLGGYRDCSLILADWLEDAGHHTGDAAYFARAGLRRAKGMRVRTFGCRWPKARHLQGVSDHQRDELSRGLTAPVAMLIGCPGVGKTYTTAAVIKAIFDRDDANIAVCAPTGKAAVRLTQAMARYGIAAQSNRWRPAVTVHRLLEIGRNGHDGGGWSFRRNRDNPLAERFVIVDEASMLDTALFASLLRACAPGTHLLLVGDPNQLPPVGHGSPLRDLIAAGYPRAELTEIHRNAGHIVEACVEIRHGRRMTPLVTNLDPIGETHHMPRNLFNVPAVGETETLAKLRSYVLDVDKTLMSLGEEGADTAGILQVLVATNDGVLGRHNVNRLMQDWCNKDGSRVSGNPFREGDKVICLRNGWYRGQEIGDDALDSNGAGQTDVYIANGEMGRVTNVEPDSSQAEFTSARVTVPNRKRRDDGEPEEGAAEDFALGYAITAHKSQGSEWPMVVVLIDASPAGRNVASREWLYTAISRAGSVCVLIGPLGTAEMMLRKVSLGKRKTFLVEEIADARDARKCHGHA